MNNELSDNALPLLLIFVTCNTCRADRHTPSYAKKIVESYNKNGQIDLMLQNK
jgi:hypothetical protein